MSNYRKKIKIIKISKKSEGCSSRWIYAFESSLNLYFGIENDRKLVASCIRSWWILDGWYADDLEVWLMSIRDTNLYWFKSSQSIDKQAIMFPPTWLFYVWNRGHLENHHILIIIFKCWHSQNTQNYMSDVIWQDFCMF